MNFCIRCGNKLKDGSKYCTKCGKEVSLGGDNYCIKCGSKLNPKNGLCMNCLVNKRNKKAEAEKVKANRESIKLSIFLNLGVVMVLAAGFILATTNWSLFSSWGKVFFILGLSVFFLFMNYISEKKLKIKISSYLYWLLAMAFILFAGIAITYLQLLGHWFSLAGPGKFLCLAEISLLFTILVLLSKYKYQKNWLNILATIGFLFIVFFVLRHFGLGWLVNLAVISSLLLAFYMYTRNSNYEIIVVALSLIIIFLQGFFTIIMRPEYNIIASIVLTICNGSLLFLIGYSNKSKTIKILSSISLFLFFGLYLNYAIVNSEYVLSIASCIVFLLLLIVFLINAINKNNDIYNVFTRTSKVCSLVCIALMICITIGVHNSQVMAGFYFDPHTDIINYLVNLVISSGILLLCNVFCIREKTSVYKSFYSCLLPACILLFSFTLINLLIKLVPDITIVVLLSLLSLIIYVLYRFQKNGILKLVMHILLYVLLGLLLFAFLLSHDIKVESLPGICALLYPCCLLLLYFQEKNSTGKSLIYRWFSIVFFALSLIRNIASLDILGFGNQIAYLLVISIFAIIVLLFLDDLIIRRFIPFMFLLALSLCTNYLNLDTIYTIMIVTVAWLGALFVFARSFKDSIYNALLVWIIPFILFEPTIYNNIYLTIFVSVICILLIFYDMAVPYIKGLFVVGIVYLIFNTLVILSNVWTFNSVWTYLLIAGIAIIAISTIMIAKNNKK